MNFRVVFALLLAFQAACTFFFLWTKLSALLNLRSIPIAWQYFELIEIGAGVGLVSGVGLTAWLLFRSLKRQATMEDSLRLASGAFMDVVEERFSTWGLTPAERDVALFSIKGFSTAEIAGLRDTSEGTVKAQTNAIYRKAGVSGRSQLLGLFIEDMVNGPET